MNYANSCTFLKRFDFTFRLLTEEATHRQLIGGHMEFSWCVNCLLFLCTKAVFLVHVAQVVFFILTYKQSIMWGIFFLPKVNVITFLEISV